MRQGSPGASIAMVALMLTACGGGGDAGSGAGVGSDAPARGGTVVIAAPQDIEAANGFVAQTRYTLELLRYALFVPLVSYGPDLDYQPALATAWRMTGDTGVVFDLRDDVRWHDGPKTTAYDVEFTFDRLKDPETAFPQASDFSEWTDAEVIDSFHIRFRWAPHAEPMAGLPFLAIMPKHALDTVPANAMARASFNHAPVGNGPFRFVEYAANDHWTFAANDSFPEGLGGRPYLDRFIWRVIPDNTAQVTELQTGGADLVLNARPEQFESLSSSESIQGIVREARQYAFVGWNERRAPFGDPRVRRALTLGMDRQRMIDALRNGRATIAIGPVGPYHWAFADTLSPLPYDTAWARALLDSAGIRDRNGDGSIDLPDGRPFHIALDYPAGSAFNRDMSEMIASDYSKLGVLLVPTPLEQNTMIGRMTSSARDFDAVLMGWEADFRVNVGDLFHSRALKGPFQIAGYSNAAVDSLIDATARPLDRAAAKPLFERLQRIMRDEEPWTFMYYYPDLYLASSRLHGVEMDIRGAFVNLARWWVASGSAGR
jgi:peptide/nickel transport system substrate-binding protein